MKAKTHAVTINGFGTRLVMAQTRNGAVRDRVAEIIQQIREQAIVDLATGEQIYEAGMNGDGILGHDRFKNAIDPNQLPLPGVSETSGTPPPNPPADDAE